MPARETELGLTELAARLHLWDPHMSTTEHPGGDVSGQINVTDRIVRFGDGAPEDALPAHLPQMLAASRKAVAAGTPVVVMSECTLVPPVLAAVRERHPGRGARLDRRPRRSQHARDDAERLPRRHAVRATARLVLRRLAPPGRPRAAAARGARGARRRPRPRSGRARERRPLAAPRVRRRGRGAGRAARRPALRARRHRRARPEPDARRGLPGARRLERRAHARRGRRARRERPRGRALDLPERSAGARRGGLAPLVDALR